MTDDLDSLVRQWAQWPDAPAPPAPPTDACLSYPQADKIARGELAADEKTRSHLQQCPYCRKLVSDFAQAFAEGPPQADPAPRDRTAILGLPARAWLAVAAGVLLAVGVGTFLLFRALRPEGGLLLAANVGLKEEIESQLTAKGYRKFADGERILFEVDLAREGYVSLVRLDPAGRVTARPPDVSSTELSRKMPAGPVRLGPYRLAGPAGPETWFVVAAGRRTHDVRARIDRLSRRFDPVKGRQTLAETLRAWPADVVVLTFDHLPPQP